MIAGRMRIMYQGEWYGRRMGGGGGGEVAGVG